MSRIRSQIYFPIIPMTSLFKQIFLSSCVCKREYQYDSEMPKLVKQFISIQDKDILAMLVL